MGKGKYWNQNLFILIRAQKTIEKQHRLIERETNKKYDKDLIKIKILRYKAR